MDIRCDEARNSSYKQSQIRQLLLPIVQNALIHQPGMHSFTSDVVGVLLCKALGVIVVRQLGDAVAGDAADSVQEFLDFGD